MPRYRTFRRGGGAAAIPDVVIDNSNAGASIQISGRAFVNAANDVWNGNTVTRYNQSRVIRISNYTPTQLVYTALSTLVGDGYTAVVVNGTLFASPQVDQDYLPHLVTVSGLPAGVKTIEIWEGPQAHEGSLNAGNDQPVAGTYVTSVQLPSGTLTKPTAANGLIITGESQGIDSGAFPWQWSGWGGQLRLAAQTAGWLLGHVAYGSRCAVGDGLTPAQTAACFHDLWAAMGSTTKKLLIYQRPNDYDYWNLSFFTTTPTQYAAFWASTMDALAGTDTFTCNLVSSFPSDPSDSSPSGGLYTKADYDTAMNGIASGRGYITLQDSAQFNLILPTDYVDNVHFNASGHTKVFTGVRAWYGL